MSKITDADALRAAMDELQPFERSHLQYVDPATVTGTALKDLGRALLESRRERGEERAEKIEAWIERDAAVKRGDDWAGRVVGADEQGMMWKEQADRVAAECDRGTCPAAQHERMATVEMQKQRDAAFLERDGYRNARDVLASQVRFQEMRLNPLRRSFEEGEK